MLECVVRVRADRVAGDVELDRAAHVLQRREARFAHHALEQHAAGDGDHDVRGFEFLVVLAVVRRVEVSRERVATKIVRVGRPTRAQRGELGATLGDDLVVVDRSLRQPGALLLSLAMLTPPASGWRR